MNSNDISDKITNSGDNMLRSRWVIVVLLFLSFEIRAETFLETQGRSFACQDASQMNLWDLASNSPLIRHQMIERNYCWRTVDGIKFELIQKVGRFVKLHNSATGQSFFVYASDVGPARVFKKIEPPPKKTIERDGVRLLAVKNSSKFGTVLIRGKPTVDVLLDAGDGLQVEFTITKERIETGFEQRITNQDSPYLQVGGKYKKQLLGVGDEFKLKVLKVDPVKRIAEFEVSGAWPKLGDFSNLTYRLLPSTVQVKGKHFDQLVRPHTPQELEKTIGSRS